MFAEKSGSRDAFPGVSALCPIESGVGYSAVFAAQKKMNPEHYGEIAHVTIDGKVGDTLTYVRQMTGDLLGASNRVQEALKKVEEFLPDTMR